MFAVNQKPLVASKLNEKDTFVFRKDSAGFGVPRATFGKLNHISSSVVQHGSVERAAYVSSIANGHPQENESRMAANHGTTAVHTMSAGSPSSIAAHSSSSVASSSSGGHSTSSSSFSGGGASMSGSAMGGSAGGGHNSGSSGGHH
jgi:hypothetical protein